MKCLALSKFFTFFVISLFVTSCLPQIEIATLAEEPGDNWIAHPMHIIQLSDPLAFSGYSPNQVRAAYNLPSSGGAGVTIAIIDAYDTPSINGDLTFFSTQFNLPLPTSSNFEVHKMSTSLSTDSSWMLETCLDVEWAHAIAPDAKILLVEARSPSSSDLLHAIDYARNRSDVVAVSMSWGGDEFDGETYFDSRFTSNYDVAFFASSGDNGSGVTWPASSANVVAVGGTTLNLNPDNTTSSETGWSGSGGGISAYEVTPDYQARYGIAAAYRSVPDVSYNANPSTGFAVQCNSSWCKVGGTSAGAPQWAAIYALGRSATNTNLYNKAKDAYSYYFRDITSGSNGGYNATIGYDYVTGLGSPLTTDFSKALTVYPTSGPAGGLITLGGMGFTVGSSANISFLNPTTSSWISIVNNLPITLQNFTYTMRAPDLLQNNPANDSQPLFDKIVFRAQEKGDGNSYETTIPYTEWRRGLTQIGDQVATGLCGNNTDLSLNVFVQNIQSLVLTGKWFNPGNASLLWDGTIDLGTTAINETGLLNATVAVPATTAGQHTLILNDGASNFCINITRLPAVTNDYDGQWHTTDFSISLTPDYNVTETYYSINGGPVFNVTANGQPIITSEGSNNTLEYWSMWDIYGTGTYEIPHVTINGVELDKTSPEGSMQINDGAVYTSSNFVTLTLSANDSLSGINHIRFSNDGTWDQNPWETYASINNWLLTSGDGVKTVYCQIEDNAGLVTTLSSSITLSTPQPFPNPLISTPSLSPTPTTSYTTTSFPSPSNSPSPQPSATPTVPELSIQMFLVLLALSALSIVVKYKERTNKSSENR